ncbi:glycosyltransferase [Vibrionales bacterium SWAT-3]|nr:glycosyltransferase [Vibrionales bacterium SWAT-3]
MKLKIITITQSSLTSAQNIRADLMLEAFRADKSISVKYCPLILDSFKKTNIVERVANKFKLISKALILTLSVRKDEVIYVYGDVPTLIFSLVTKRAKKVVYERTEYPNQVLNAGKEIYVQELKKIRNIDGFITCSEALSKYYRQYFNHDKVFDSYYPVNVDMFDIVNKVKMSQRQDYIAYAGFMGGNKDGLTDLIKTFSKIDNKSIVLKLAGSGPEEEVKALKALIFELGLERRVQFLGSLKRAEIPEFFCKAKLCVLQRPSNIQAKGGMPSKLLEYIASGTPTIVTNVGEIRHYFKDKFDCIIVEPDSREKFCDAINDTLKNYSDSLLVAEQGRKTIKEHDYLLQSAKLIQFLKVINES